MPSLMSAQWDGWGDKRRGRSFQGKTFISFKNVGLSILKCKHDHRQVLFYGLISGKGIAKFCLPHLKIVLWVLQQMHLGSECFNLIAALSILSFMSMYRVTV